MTAANQDFVTRKLARLRREKQRAEARLEDLAAIDYKPPDIEATVDAILLQLKDFPRVAAQGSVEERKQFVRGFVAGITPSTPERTGVVRRIFEMYVGGHGFKPIARRLNEESVSSPRNQGWSRMHDGHWALSTVRALIMNPVYAGDLVWNRRTWAKFHSIADGRAVKRSAVVSGKRGVNEEQDWVVVRNTHEPLISRELSERVRAIRKRREARNPGHWNTGGRGRSSPFLLTGLIRCEACGHKFQGYTITKSKAQGNGRQVRTLYYGCGGYITKGNAVCRRYLIRQDRLDAYVLGLIEKQVKRFLARGGMKLLREMVKEELGTAPEDPRPEMARLRKRLKEIDEKADQLLEMMTPANQDFVTHKLAKLRRERQRTEARLEDLASIDYKPPDVEATVDAILAQLKDFPRVAAQGSVEERKEFVRGFVSLITVRPHKEQASVLLSRMPSLEGEHTPDDSAQHRSHVFALARLTTA